jgi:hypothetical protein
MIPERNEKKALITPPSTKEGDVVIAVNMSAFNALQRFLAKFGITPAKSRLRYGSGGDEASVALTREDFEKIINS